MHERIRGLDSLRFLCATLVVLGHIGIPVPLSVALATNIQNGLANLFNSPAAVIVFFVISGFCIHYPYQTRTVLPLYSYYTRRLIRILVPAGAAIGLWRALGEIPQAPDFGIFWSVLCEVIYYLLYPLLFLLRKKFTWEQLITATMLLALGLTMANLELLRIAHNGYTALGLWTWLVGLPCWLMGCWLAENYTHFPELSMARLALVRGAIFLTSIALRVVKFHVASPLASNCFTLNLFACALVGWLGLEIGYYRNPKNTPRFEKLGLWSYSLYLLHPIGHRFLFLPANLHWPKFTLHSATLLLAFVVPYIFYLIVERPSHRLARYVAARKNS
ncbi:acyltransferase family protein [Armatimonas sp.]|uniref:acyltransferase family protein n=1 Tax=Armatimonas sp. TaxID=1872638 RepID=UPI0037523B34